MLNQITNSTNDFLNFNTSAFIIILVIIFCTFLSLDLYLKYIDETLLTGIFAFSGMILSLYAFTQVFPLTPWIQLIFFLLNLTILCLTYARA